MTGTVISGGRRPLRLAANGPLLALIALKVADRIVTRRLRGWIKHATATKFG